MKKAIIIIAITITFINAYPQTGQDDFKKLPYLIYDNNPTEMKVLWQLISTNECLIKWGLTDLYELSSAQTLESGNGQYEHQHIYTIGSLTPSTKYYYKVLVPDPTGQEFTSSAEGDFFTAPDQNETEVTFYAYGDTRNDNPMYQNNVLGNLLNLIENTTTPHPQTILLHAGDWVSQDTEAHWEDDFFNLDYDESIRVKSMMPIMGVIGNHDYYVNLGAIYRKYWPYNYYSQDVDDFYYSFDYGPVHFTMVEHKAEGSDDPISEEQLLWIENDLKNTDKKWKVMMFHAPAYSSGHHSNSTQAQQKLQPLCIKYCVDLALCGHNHYYAHWQVDGIHHLTLGGGGVLPLYTPTSTTGNGHIFSQETFHFAAFDYTDDDITINIYKPTDENPISIEDFTIKKTYNFCNNENVVWENGQSGLELVKVCKGSTLTIKSHVSFAEEGKLIVERGGKLIIDGGTLTGCCDNHWAGIELWGNKYQSQSYTNQGVVEVLNGGTIENAICGINTIKMVDNTVPPPEDYIPDYNYSGGMVICDGGIFKNNRTAVKFWPYNYSTSASLFRNCQFISNDDMLDGTNPETFIELSDISGIIVGGSSFTDSHSVSNPDELTTGIEAYGSQFKVWAIGGPSVFSGLFYGIKTHSLNPSETVEIASSDFLDNFRGIYISGITNAKVTGNDFSINSPFSTFNGGYGLYLDNSTAYTIEENNFYHEVGDPVGVGLIVHNSGENANEIYRNWFTNLKQGISCQEQNRVTNDPAPGLQILCNDFSDCTADVLVPLPGLSSYGIAPKQGIDGNDVTDMAGNMFFYNEVADDYDDLNNEGAFFEYFYPENPHPLYVRTKPEDYTTKTVKIQERYITSGSWTFEDGCPPNEAGGGGGGTGRDEMRSSMASAQQEITVTEATLAMLVDGGDTEALNTEVETSIPPETVEVYNELMNGSPYLSETVVETSIEKENVLPNAMIRDVMVANPHTSKSDVLMEKLDDRLVPLPEYMKAQILEGRELTSLKEELESQLAGYQLKKARAFNGLARSFINESITLQEASDSLLLLFQQDGDLQSKYRLAFLHLERGEYQLGETALDNIPIQYGLEADELTNHQNIDSYYSLVREIREVGNSLMEADEPQVQALQVIEASGTGVASTWARDVLIALGETTYEEPIQMPDLLKSAEAIEAYEKLLNTKPPQMLEVYPNPSKGYVILGYKLEMEAKGSIEIQDVAGKAIKVIQTNSMQDQITLVTQDWKPGVYIATFKIDGKTMESVKFTLVK